MKRLPLFLFAAVLGVTGCTSSTATTPPAANTTAHATAPKETPASALVDRSGDSVETAVEVPADAPEEGVPFQNDWIFDRIGRFRRTGGGTGQLNGRRYDVIEVETPKGDHFKFYFDITENWKKWQKPEVH